jgi:NAD(P)-dependent dehydrogenase (short-subunit alcohol dehydrogenase family)
MDIAGRVAIVTGGASGIGRSVREPRRADDRERWLRGMRRMQARLSGRP